MSKNMKHSIHCSVLVMTIIFSAFFALTDGNTNATEVNAVSEMGPDSKSPVISAKTPNGRSIKDNSNNMLDKSQRSEHKNRESIRKENDMYDVMRLHQINSQYDQEFKADQEKKEKGKLQTVGGVIGEIIAVLVSEVVKLFGNMVSDVAREVTAHGFVSIFKQFTDLTGISLPEI